MKDKMPEFKHKTNYVQGMDREDVIREFEVTWKPVEDQCLQRIKDAVKPREVYLESIVNEFNKLTQFSIEHVYVTVLRTIVEDVCNACIEEIMKSQRSLQVILA